MRITVDLDEGKLAEVLAATGQTKKSPAVVQALEEFLKDRARDKFLARVLDGETDYGRTNAELEAAAYDGGRRGAK